MFWTYNQNNSGGSFVADSKRGITHYVIIEADTAEKADAKAEEIGLYFDDDRDCPCCGSRWSSAWGKGDKTPSIYGTKVEEYELSCAWISKDRAPSEVAIHYKDGRIVWPDVKQPKDQ